MKIRRSRLRAMTMVELTISMGVGLAIFGLVLEIMIDMGNRTESEGKKEAMMIEGRLIAQTITRVLEDYVPPEDLDGIPEGFEESFTERSVGIISTTHSSGDRFYFQIIKGRPHPRTRRLDIVDIKYPLDRPITAANTLGARPLGAASGDFDLDMRFRYAMEFNVLEPYWVAEVPAGQRPRVVEVTLIISDPGNKSGPVEIVTAVAL